jgi:hypothetical protein
MIAMAETPMKFRFQRINWSVLQYRNSILLEPFEETRRCLERAETVIFKSDVNSMVLPLDQSVGKHLSDWTVGKCEHYDIDVVSGAVNSL